MEDFKDVKSGYSITFVSFFLLFNWPFIFGTTNVIICSIFCIFFCKNLQNFKPNPYFEDTKLTKTFTFCDDETKITGTIIKWKEGMVVATP